MNLVPRLIRPLAPKFASKAALAGMLAGAMLLSGCTSMGVNGNRDILVQDMYEVKQNLNEYIKNQAETDRKTTYQLSALDENVQKNGTISKTAIDELEKRVREQNEELTAIKAKLEELKFAVDSKRGGAGMTATSPDFGTGAPGTLGMTPPDPNAPNTGGEVAATGQGSVEQLLDSSRRQFLLGNYDAARQGLEAAKALDPQGDQKVEVYFYLGECDLAAKNITAADQNYTTAIKANNSHPKSWISLERHADIMAQTGQAKIAIALYQQIAKKNADYPNSANPEDVERIKKKIADLQAGMVPPPL